VHVQYQIQQLESQLNHLKQSLNINQTQTAVWADAGQSPDDVSQCDFQQPWTFGDNCGLDTGGCGEFGVCESPSAGFRPTVKVSGFFQADLAWFHQDTANEAVLGDIQDGADFRRARLAATGNVWENVSYMLEMDFAFPGRPSFMDVWLQLEDVGSGSLRIGQFRHPIGMDGQTSVKELPFLERALPFAFLPFRQIGAMYFGHSPDKDVTWAFSGFRYPTDTFGGNVGDSGGYGLASRLTTVLVDSDGELVHIGGGYSFADPANNVLRYRNQPEFFVAETGGAGLVPLGVPSSVPAFVDTDLIAAKNFHLLNAELAASSGSLHAQSEVYVASVNQTGGPQLTFSGAYVHAGYFLTGESRPYNREAGVFGRVDPASPFGSDGCGAWEVAARWSILDLNDANVQGGKLTDLTFGLNWYLNRYTKFQLNYIRACLDHSSAVYGPVVNNSSADIIALRAQIDF
jgi:phosphate-selective porin OprO/OprP